MKRNNYLMLSFIILIAVCAFAKSLWDYPMWHTVVAAITVASWFFAIADLCLCQSNLQLKLTNEQLNLTESSLDEVEMIKKAVNIRIKQVKEKKNQETDNSSSLKLYTTQDELNYLISVEEDVKEIEKDLQSYYENLIKGQKGSKTNHFIGSSLSVLGFLVFFIIIIFRPLQEFQNSGLDELTVWSFFVILLTQYLEGSLQEHKNKKKQEGEKVFSALDALRKNFESEVIHND